MVTKPANLILLLGITLLLPQLLFGADLRAVTDRDRLALGESLQLQLRINGSPTVAPDFSVIESDWEILNRSQSSQMQIVNGDINRSQVTSLALLPRHAGDLQIPPICAGDDCSQPLTIRVSAAPDQRTGNEPQTLILESELSPTESVEQQQLLFTLRLLTRVELLRGSLTEPEATGVEAMIEKLGEDRRYETRRQGYLYHVIERSYAIFPQQNGTLTVSPVRFDGEIRQERTGYDPFGNRGRVIRRATKELQARISAPPTDRGRRSWLPTAELKLKDDWQDRTLRLKVGEPATRTLTLTAKGLQSAQLPDIPLPLPASLKGYPDQPSRQNRINPTGLVGQLQQKIALVATRPGRYHLPEIDLDWWSTEDRSWQTAHLDPVEIEVTAPDNDATLVQPPAVEPAPPTGIDSPAAPRPETNAGFWPWLSLGLACGWGVSLIWLWRRGRGRQKATTRKQEEPSPRTGKALKTVLQAARDNDPRLARKALLLWGREQWPEAPPIGLEELQQRVGEELSAVIFELNRALFRQSAESWSGQRLAAALNNGWQPKARKATAPLPDLYPEDRRP